MNSNTNLEDVNDDQDAYYTFLGVDKNASDNEITAAYRKLSKLYHPDKHTDEEKKKNANALFQKIQRIYEVLSDPQKRAIYDRFGEKYLSPETWEKVTRSKNTMETLQIFERINKEHESKLEKSITNPTGTCNVQIDATEMFQNDSKDFVELILDFPMRITSMSLSQSVDFPINENHSFNLNGSILSNRDNGVGVVTTVLKSQINEKTTGEFIFGFGNGPILGFDIKRTLFDKNLICAKINLRLEDEIVLHPFNIEFIRFLSKSTIGSVKLNILDSVCTTVTNVNKKRKIIVKFQLGIWDSFLSYMYSYYFLNGCYISGMIRLGTRQSSLEYRFCSKVTKYSIFDAAVNLNTIEGVTLKLSLFRGNQIYSFNILMGDEFLPAPILYSTLCPLLLFYGAKYLVNRYAKSFSTEKIEDMPEAQSKEVEKKQLAKSAVELMGEVYERNKNAEIKKNGLIISFAIYGNERQLRELLENDYLIADLSNLEHTYNQLWLVTVPLQMLVQNSTLYLPSTSKCNLPGFYDPSPNVLKKLFIKYMMNGETFQKEFDDLDLVEIL